MRIHPRSGLRGRALLATSVLSVAAGLTLAPVASAAAPAAAFSVEPVTGASAKGWFVLAPAAGATARGSVRVVNSGNAVGTVRLDAVDATTGRTSGAVYRDRALTPSDVGR